MAPGSEDLPVHSSIKGDSTVAIFLWPSKRTDFKLANCLLIFSSLTSESLLHSPGRGRIRQVQLHGIVLPDSYQF